MKLTSKSAKNTLLSFANSDKAQVLRRFFKTDKGQYAEGDIFIGVMVPVTRRIAKTYANLPLTETEKLLKSKEHEARLLALFIMKIQFDKGTAEAQKKIHHLFLNNIRFINNWDLVDLSAPTLVGEFLANKNKNLLYKLSRSKNLWERRIAIIATFAFIRNNEPSETFKISAKLLNDKHDLIHKAVGWMLREAGKRDIKKEEAFLRKYYSRMPRTMLRYAIERFPERKRKAYLRGEI
ncbi:MAG: DNA alkylation repair protein [Candidatus Omnitrophica bacterium]|nr:DNA alkylation repair protein [Candidatus Omnitrophota bacterium]